MNVSTKRLIAAFILSSSLLGSFTQTHAMLPTPEQPKKKRKIDGDGIKVALETQGAFVAQTTLRHIEKRVADKFNQNLVQNIFNKQITPITQALADILNAVAMRLSATSQDDIINYAIATELANILTEISKSITTYITEQTKKVKALTTEISSKVQQVKESSSSLSEVDPTEKCTQFFTEYSIVMSQGCFYGGFGSVFMSGIIPCLAEQIPQIRKYFIASMNNFFEKIGHALSYTVKNSTSENIEDQLKSRLYIACVSYTQEVLTYTLAIMNVLLPKAIANITAQIKP